MTNAEKAKVNNPAGFAVLSMSKYGSAPFMFAFSDKNGLVKVWSIQSNNQLPDNETFVVHDKNGMSKEPNISIGRFITIQPTSA